jgi:sugar phosphate isomerase/epimerase
MKLGVYTAILHDRPLEEALDVIASLGLDAAEINAGGFLPPVHIPIDDVIDSQDARDDYLGLFEARGITLAGLNANGNPLHPNPVIGDKHASDLKRAIRAAGALGQTRVVTMSGLPGGEPGATVPNWVVNAWNTGALDMLDYQWDLVAVPFWEEIDKLAADHGVKVAIEMHPQNLVFNPPTLKRLVERIGATNVGAEMDPSHPVLARHGPGSRRRVPRRPGRARGRQGCADQRGELHGLRRARRAVPAPVTGGEPTQPGRSRVRGGVAEGLVLGLRRAGAGT